MARRTRYKALKKKTKVQMEKETKTKYRNEKREILYRVQDLIEK